MQLSVAAFLAIAGSALAQFVDPTAGFDPLTNPTANEVIPAGKPFTIKWTQGGPTGPISLYAYAGDSASTLQEVGTIATGLDASLGKYDWNVDVALGGKYKAYGIKIALASNKNVYQWSQPFTISGSGGASTAPGSSSAVPSSASSSAGSSAAQTGTTYTPTTLATTTSCDSSTTSAPTVTSVSIPVGNLSTTAAGLPSTSGPVTLPSASGNRPAGTTTAPASVPTGAAVTLGASSFAVLGGLAMAVMAL